MTNRTEATPTPATITTAKGMAHFLQLAMAAAAAAADGSDNNTSGMYWYY